MVTLRELFEEDDDGLDIDIPRILVEITQAELDSLSFILEESRWNPSAVKGLWVRLDPHRPEMKQCRHVHVAQKKHIKSPDQQAAWNDNTTRHDRKRFNTKFADRADVKAVAKTALGLSPETILEDVRSKAAMLLEKIDEAQGMPYEKRLRSNNVHGEVISDTAIELGLDG